MADGEDGAPQDKPPRSAASRADPPSIKPVSAASGSDAILLDVTTGTSTVPMKTRGPGIELAKLMVAIGTTITMNVCGRYRHGHPLR